MLLRLGRVRPKGMGRKQQRVSGLSLADDDAAGGVIGEAEKDRAKGAGKGQGEGRLKGEIAKRAHWVSLWFLVSFLCLGALSGARRDGSPPSTSGR